MRASQTTTQNVESIHFTNVQLLPRMQYELENIAHDDNMKVIPKSSFHLFLDFSPLTLPFLLGGSLPFAFTFLRVLLWD